MEIELDRSPTEESIAKLYNGFAVFNEPHFPGLREEKIALYVRGNNKSIVGGLFAKIHYSTVNIKYIWVAEEMRDKGFGSKMLRFLEKEVKKFGVIGIYLDTYSFQAPVFYEKHGFSEIGRYKDYPKLGIDKIFYEKRLGSES